MALAALLAAGALAFGACNGSTNDDDKDTGGKTPAAEKTTAGGSDETAEPEPTEEDDNGGGGGGDSGDLLEIAAKFESATFHVVYQMSGGDLGGITNGEITIYKDGTDRLRFDIKGEQDGEAFEATFIETGTDSFLCFAGEAAAGLGALIGVDTSAGVCIKSAPDDPTNPVGNLVTEIQSFDLENVEFQSKEEMEIAGEDATCYTVLDTETNETNVACFNDDGVLLSVESGGDVSLVATSVEGDVSAGDFEPPYTVQEIPGLGQ